MATLTVNNTKDGDKLTSELIGRIDVMTAPQFESEVTSELEGVNALTLDMGKLEYISSAGLRVVVGLQKTMTARRGSLTLRSMSENIMDIFTATGLTDYLDIE